MMSFDELEKQPLKLNPPPTSATSAVAQAGTAAAPQESPGFFGYAADALMGIPRGVLSAASSVANLPSIFSEKPTFEKRFGLMGDSTTFAGDLTEGISNFAVGFVPVFGMVGKASQALGLGRAAAMGTAEVIAASNTARAAAVAAEAAGLVSEAATATAQVASLGAKVKAAKGLADLGKTAVASGITGFTVFDGQQDRLSNLVQQYPSLQNPLTEFLQATPEDSMAVGRLKNALEEASLGSVLDVALQGFRMYKAGYAAKLIGKDADQAVIAEARAIRNEHRQVIKQALPSVTNDKEAEAVNVLIDYMGIDRSKLSLQGGDAAQKTLQEILGTGGEALAQARKVTDRIPELQDAANKLKAGEITREEYSALVDQYKPVTPYESVPEPATMDQMSTALDSKQVPRLGKAAESLKDGDPVGLRLDIKAYSKHNTWVVSIHEQDPGFAAGKSIGYESTASVTNATFGMSEKAALTIAAGNEKGTIATIKGDWKAMSPAEAKSMADAALNSPEWRQVGMDPTRHSYFYDRATMQPVTAADEVIQVGPLVLAKNVKYAPAEKFLFQRARFDATANLPKSATELKGLLTPEEWSSIKSPASLTALINNYKTFKKTMVPQLRAAIEMGAPVQGGYEEGAQMFRTLVGDTRSELFAGFSSATSPQNQVSSHTRLGLGITADFIERVRGGNLSDITAEEMKAVIKNVGGRLNVKGMAEGYSKGSSKIANDFLGRLRTLKEANPDASIDDLINKVDTAGLYKNLAGSGMKPGAGKTPSFMEASAGRMDNVVLDTYMAKILPDSMFKGLEPKAILNAKKAWLAKAPNYSAFSATMRKLSGEMGIMPAQAQERAWGTAYTIAALKRMGVPSKDIFKNITNGDLLASWNLLQIIEKPEVLNELTRLGASKGLLEDLAGISSTVRAKVRPFLDSELTVTDAGAFEVLAGRVPRATGAAGKEVISARKAAKILMQDAGQPRGFATFADEGRAVVGLLEGADVDTAIHEFAHIARRNIADKNLPSNLRWGLSEADIDTMSRASGALPDGTGGWTWDVKAEENFANMMMRWVRDGAAPSGMERTFGTLTNWMRNLYRDVTNTDVDINVSKEVAATFDKLVQRGPGIDSKVRAVTTAVVGDKEPKTLFQANITPPTQTLGKPGGTPNEPINWNRFNSSAEVSEYTKNLMDQAGVTQNLDEPAQSLDSLATAAQGHMADIRDTFGLDLPVDLRGRSQYDLAQFNQKLVALRTFGSSVASRMKELSGIAKTGATLTDEQLYEFARGEQLLQASVQSIKYHYREVARTLGGASIVPEPIKDFRILPAMEKAAEAPRIGPGASVADDAARAAATTGVDPNVPTGSMEAGAGPGAGPGMGPGLGAGEGPGLGAGAGPGAGPGMGPGAGPGAGPGMGPGMGPGAGPGLGGATPTNPLLDPTARARIVNDQIEQSGGRDNLIARMRKYNAAAVQGGDRGVMELSRGYRAGNAIVEYWMNSILSAPGTSVVNTTANLFTSLYLPFERAVGATLRADLKEVRTALQTYVYMVQQMTDVSKLAFAAFKSDGGILEAVGTTEAKTNVRAISSANFGMQEGTTGSMAVDWIGTVLNLPTRFLTAQDEFFKQLNYRAYYKAELFNEGITRFNGNTTQAAQWVEDTFKKTIVDGQQYSERVVLGNANKAADEAISAGSLTADGRQAFIMNYMGSPDNWDPNLGALARTSMERARYATFQTTLDTQSTNPLIAFPARLQQAVAVHPALRFILPFIRTPTNILNFALQRSLPLNLKYTKSAFGDYNKLLTHSDAAIRADAMGRLAFASSVTVGVGFAAFNGNITGGGPKNKSERDALLATGWQPYSIKVGDSYVSYRRLDPFASVIGLVADVVEGLRYADEKHMDPLTSSLNVALLALSSNFTNKTYLTGFTALSNVLSDPSRFGQNFINQYAGSMVPFSGALNQSKGSFNDDVIRETRGMLDAVRNKIPGLAEGLAPKRNIFGDPLRRAEAYGPDWLSPFTYTKVKDDPLANEFAKLGHSFTSPKETKGAVDLTQFKTAGGQEAYDRWLELHGKVKIGGKTLRDQLMRLVNSQDYQNLSPESTDQYDSPRIRRLRSVVASYREAAYQQVLKESPELANAANIDFANKQAMRLGRPVSELINLANR
jgi:hypothetical protein